MDLWKERIWTLVENSGLLPNIAWKDDKAMDDYRDSWDDNNEEDLDADLEEQSFKVFGFGKV